MVAPPNDHGDRFLSCWQVQLGLRFLLIELMITQLVRMFVNEFKIKNIVQQGYDTYYRDMIGL